MWREILTGLAEQVRLDPVAPGQRAARSDVWLSDGHQGPLGVDGPRVVHVHEAGWTTPELRALLDRDFLEIIETRTGAAGHDATLVVTPSAAARAQLEVSYGIDRQRVRVVPHGVDHDTFRPEAKSATRPAPPYVLFVSQLHPRKNLQALRDAMVAIGERGLPHALMIVGRPALDRRDGADLEASLTAPLPGRTNGVVRVLDPDDRALATLMADADVFCLPSLMEGFGLTALEAMACGTAVVVTDRGSLPELVADAGIIVEPTAASIEAALSNLLAHDAERRALAKAGLERAQSFTWRRAVDGWVDVLHEAVDHG
jgi:glycosyltransferase involved in cell wall biosynthesis